MKPAQPAMPAMLDAKQLRSILNIPEGSWCYRLAQGRVPPANGKLGQSFYWLKSDVDDWLSRQTTASASEV